MLLVNAADLIRWADHRDAQATLPQLVRRLVLATGQRVSRASFRSGEGVQLPGWDGVVVAEEASAFVPAGVSAWEVSAGSDIRGKADDDYRRRTEDPGEIDPAQTTFVFVAPRRWPAKEKWRATRRQEGRWRDVRTHDADDLETCLELAPAVHLWLSALLGKRPDGAVDLETFWEDWRAATRPPTPPDLLLAGRQEVVRRIHEWLRAGPAPLSLQAETREEATAIFSAALQTLPDEECALALSRAVILRSENALHQLAAHEPPCTFVMDLNSTTAVAHATRRGHRVLVPVGWEASPAPGCVTVPRLPVDGAAKALAGAGLAEDPARALAILARRSLPAFRRKLALLPEVQQPAWARPDEGPALVTLMLAGSWDDAADGDREALARLGGGSYERLSATLARWENTSDPPVRRVGDVWYVISREDAWGLLARYLDQDALRRFEEVVLAVLGTPDPRFDLPESERYMANVLGKSPRCSRLLCRGLVESLAVIATSIQTSQVRGARAPSDVAPRIASELLQRAKADWRVWASLSEWGALSLLAEAAPDAFLRAIDDGLADEEPVLLRLFARDDCGIFVSSPHTGLLWALEVIAWSGEHIGYASRVLAKLARLDPGGKLANRPQNSLRAIFLPWLPQTAASPEQRLRVLDTLRVEEPEVAWKLMIQLLPKGQDVGDYTAKPRWREWHPGTERRITRAEYSRMVRELVARLVQDATQDGDRWKDLVEALPDLAPDLHGSVLEGMERLESEALREADRSAIWHALRSLLSHHRSFPDAAWTLPAGMLERLDVLMGHFEPASPQSRFGWLFGHHPELPDGHQGDWREREKEVGRRRVEAARTLHAQSGIATLLSLAEGAGRPDAVGAAFAQTEAGEREEDRVLSTYLAAAEAPAHAQFARGFAWGRILVEGREWAETKVSAVGIKWTPEQQAEFLACLPPDARTWDLVSSLGPVPERCYWQLIQSFGIGETDAERGARSFLEHGRPHAAVSLLADHRAASPSLAADALEAFVNAPHGTQAPHASIAYEIGKLLDRLQGSAEIERSRVARLEWVLLPLLRHDREPRVLHKELARSPEFFVEVLTFIFRAEGEEAVETSRDDRARARHAYELLNSWRTIPGDLGGGSVDGDELAAWIVRARVLLEASGRRKIGDERIGELLSGSPVGPDGAWPHPAVRDVIERLGSADIEQGIVIGRYNCRGVVAKSPYDGGAQERGIAEGYHRDARAVADRWPRTAAMLRRMADAYRAEAAREDLEAELGQDLDG